MSSVQHKSIVKEVRREPKASHTIRENRVHFEDALSVSRTEPPTKKISSLLPKGVISTLMQKEKLLQAFEQRCGKSKRKIEQDVDSMLKQIILVFEEFKQQLYVKIDDHMISYTNLFSQFESLSFECSDWAEQRIAECDQYKTVKVTVDDNLYNHLNEVRSRKQKADEIEQALLAIKQKIDQLKLNELNNDVLFLADDKNPDIYVSSETAEFSERIKTDLRDKLGRVDQNRLIRPFIMDQKSVTGLEMNSQVFAPVPVLSVHNSMAQPDVRASQNFRSYDSKINLQPSVISIHKRSEAQSILPQYKLNTSNLAANDADRSIINRQSVLQRNEGPIIAHQNQFLSDEISLAYPSIRQEKDIPVKHDFKINCVISLSAKLLMLGAEDGSLILVDLTQDSTSISQLVLKGHSSAVKGLTKANETLVLSSAEKPDTNLKLWDLSTVTDFVKSSIETSRTGTLLLVSSLKGLTDRAVGHGFLNERVVIGMSRLGELCIWDWKLATPLTQYDVRHANVTSFILFTDKESFALGTSDGLILAYSITKTANGYDFVKQAEIQDTLPITQLHSFRGNNDIIIVTLSSGEAKLISKKAKINYHTIKGCKNPLAYFVLTWVKSDPNIYLMALEQFGFKMADIDGKDFSYVNTESKNNYKFENNGWPLWQIIDAVPKQRFLFVTISSASKPNTVILWSLQASNK